MTKKLQTTEKLVEVHGEKLTTTSFIIATNCGVTHEAVIKLTRKSFYLNKTIPNKTNCHLFAAVNKQSVPANRVEWCGR
ncbi:MAG: hypothetical protein WCI06_08840 [Methylococcaceae bacterium]